MTKREAILAALKGKLVSVTGVADSSVYRSHVTALRRATLPAISIEPISDRPQESVIGYIDWTLVARVAIFVMDADKETEADPIIESVHSKIMTDVSLGGLSMDIAPGNVSFEILDADQPVALVTMDFTVAYRTSTVSVSA